MFPHGLADVAEAQLRAGVYSDALSPSYSEMAEKDFSAVLAQFPGPSLILNGEKDASSRRSSSGTRPNHPGRGSCMQSRST